MSLIPQPTWLAEAPAIDLDALIAEAEATDAPGSSMRWAFASAEDRAEVLRLAALTRSNEAQQAWRVSRPLTPNEQAEVDRILEGMPPLTHGPTAPTGERDATSIAECGAVASIGQRTGADLSFGLPPDQLADPYLTPEGATVVYARGGTGKGVFTCWIIGRLVRTGHVVMVLDYEGHEREWGSRLRGLGLTDDELVTVHYRAPFGADWTAPTGSLAAVAGLVRDDVAALGVTYLVIDSYTVATSNGDTMGGEAAAREYFTGLATIGLPSLTIAHVRGDSSRFPDRPFGSVFVHNLARETWAVERVGDETPDLPDPDLIAYGPHVVALELRNKKSNGRRQATAQFVTFSFFADGSIEVTGAGSGTRSVADLAADVLRDGPLTLAQVASAIREDTGEAVTMDALRVTLKRHPERFAEASSVRPRTWTTRR